MLLRDSSGVQTGRALGFSDRQGQGSAVRQQQSSPSPSSAGISVSRALHSPGSRAKGWAVWCWGNVRAETGY